MARTERPRKHRDEAMLLAMVLAGLRAGWFSACRWPMSGSGDRRLLSPGARMIPVADEFLRALSGTPFRLTSLSEAVACGPGFCLRGWVHVLASSAIWLALLLMAPGGGGCLR